MSTSPELYKFCATVVDDSPPVISTLTISPALYAVAEFCDVSDESDVPAFSVLLLLVSEEESEAALTVVVVVFEPSAFVLVVESVFDESLSVFDELEDDDLPDDDDTEIENSDNEKSKDEEDDEEDDDEKEDKKNKKEDIDDYI